MFKSLLIASAFVGGLMAQTAQADGSCCCGGAAAAVAVQPGATTAPVPAMARGPAENRSFSYQPSDNVINNYQGIDNYQPNRVLTWNPAFRPADSKVRGNY